MKRTSLLVLQNSETVVGIQHWPAMSGPLGPMPQEGAVGNGLVVGIQVSFHSG